MNSNKNNLKNKIMAVLLAAGFTVNGVLNPPDVLTDMKDVNTAPPPAIVEVYENIDSSDVDLSSDETDTEKKKRKIWAQMFYSLPRVVRIAVAAAVWILSISAVFILSSALASFLPAFVLCIFRWLAFALITLACSNLLLKAFSENLSLRDIFNKKNAFLLILSITLLFIADSIILLTGFNRDLVSAVRISVICAVSIFLFIQLYRKANRKKDTD